MYYYKVQNMDTPYMYPIFVSRSEYEIVFEPYAKFVVVGVVLVDCSKKGDFWFV